MDLCDLSSTVWLCLAVLFCFLYRGYNSAANHFWKIRNVASDNPFLSLGIVSLFLNKKTIIKLEEEQYKKHGRICGFYKGISPMLMVADPDLIKSILVKDFSIFPERKTVTIEKFMGSMLLFLEGPKWKRIRNLLSPVFTSGKIRKLSNLVNKSAEAVTKSLLRSANNNTNVELKSLFGAFTMDVIASTAFGIETDSIENPDSDFVRNAKKILPFKRDWKTLFSAFAPKIIANKITLNILDEEATHYLSEMISRIKEKRLNEGTTRDDFLQMLMNAEADDNDCTEKKATDLQDDEISDKKPLTSAELVAQCVMFFLAGYDTTSTALAFTAYHLALNPECQEKLMAEVDEMWQKHGSADFDTVKNLPYLDAFVSESLRLAPPVPRLERRGKTDYQLGDTGIVLPKGTPVTIPIYSMHHDPEFFPDPEAFKPERFFPENKDCIQPYTYLPFGSGPKNCVGMRFAMLEVKLLIVHMLRKVTFHVCSGTKVPPRLLSTSFQMQPESIELGVRKRSHQTEEKFKEASV